MLDDDDKAYLRAGQYVGESQEIKDALEELGQAQRLRDEADTRLWQLQIRLSGRVQDYERKHAKKGEE